VLFFVVYNHPCAVYSFDEPAGDRKAGLALDLRKRVMEFIVLLLLHLGELVLKGLPVRVQLFYLAPRGDCLLLFRLYPVLYGY
jgi:hypothetical protein